MGMLEAIRRITIISEDAIGPVTRSVYIEYKSGKTSSLTRSRDIENLADELSRESPDVARLLQGHLSAEKHNNWEAVIYDHSTQ